MTRYSDQDIERLLESDHDVEPPANLAAVLKAEIPEDLAAVVAEEAREAESVAVVVPFHRRVLRQKWLLTAATVVMTAGVAWVALRLVAPESSVESYFEDKAAAPQAAARQAAETEFVAVTVEPPAPAEEEAEARALGDAASLRVGRIQADVVEDAPQGAGTASPGLQASGRFADQLGAERLDAAQTDSEHLGAEHLGAEDLGAERSAPASEVKEEAKKTRRRALRSEEAQAGATSPRSAQSPARAKPTPVPQAPEPAQEAPRKVNESEKILLEARQASPEPKPTLSEPTPMEVIESSDDVASPPADLMADRPLERSAPQASASIRDEGAAQDGSQSLADLKTDHVGVETESDQDELNLALDSSVILQESAVDLRTANESAFLLKDAALRREEGLWAAGEPWEALRKELEAGQAPRVPPQRRALLLKAWEAVRAPGAEELAQGQSAKQGERFRQDPSIKNADPERALVERLLDALAAEPPTEATQLHELGRSLLARSEEIGSEDLRELAALAVRAAELAEAR